MIFKSNTSEIFSDKDYYPWEKYSIFNYQYSIKKNLANIYPLLNIKN